jgi:type I restriction enzyme S subunit
MIERSKCMNVPELRFKGFKKEWDFCSVGDFYYFKNGLNKGKEFFGFGTPIVNFTDVFNNRGLTSDILKGRVSLSKKEISSFEVKKGDIFFTRTSETLEEIGYPSVMLDESNDTVFSGFVLRRRAINKDPLSDLFKKYVFFTKNFRKEMIRKSSMTTRALTSGTSIKKMEFYFPENKMEQEKIGIFHSIIEKEIIFITTKIKLLKQIKAASLQSMFPQEGETVPKVRFKGFEGEWEKIPFGSFLKESYERSTVENEDILLSSAITGVYLNSELFGHQRGASNIGYKKIKKNMLILSAQNLHLGNANVNLRFEHGLISPAYKVYEIVNISPLFLQQWIKMDSTKSFFLNATTAGASLCRKNIVWDDLYKQIVLIPSKNEQVKIGLFFSNLDKQISLQTQRLEKLKQIKAACLDKMFV